MDRERLLENIKIQIKNRNHIVGVVTGTGMTAKYAEKGGADFLLMLKILIIVRILLTDL
ncbi:phosphoenolpyruvate hydrolase family protein [Clostridium sp. JS66]|nr:phosphoenolpyruvate hydrolase family protein [Clostridium sp. JS66]WPC43345.1 phosphoenolpyruvate hydrolase family protein [Clostridium sp. JS66]